MCNFRFVEQNIGKVPVMICHKGRWVTFDKEKKYIGCEEKGVVGSKSIKLMKFLEITSKIACCGADVVTLAYSILMGPYANKLYFLEYNLAVIGMRVTPIYVSMLHISGSMNPPFTKVPLWLDATFEVTSTLAGKQRVLGTTEVPFEDGDYIDWYGFDSTVVTTFITQNAMSMADSNEVQPNRGVCSGEFRIAKDEVSHLYNLVLLNDRHLQVNMRLGGHMMRGKFNDLNTMYNSKDVVRDIKTTLRVIVRDLLAKYLNDVGVEKWSQARMNGKRYNATYSDSIYPVLSALQRNAKHASKRTLVLPPTGKATFQGQTLETQTKQCSYEDNVSRFKVSEDLEMKKKVYTNLHSGTKANKNWFDVSVTDKRRLFYRSLF
ncbi:S ribonuclease [Pyrus ussuriensis x Pyrus communis]|uniref:S ribonuclease n=1 Tax=Pyrus ussuriensis x Pyrus communis TaxID=2448454 RepID=A0A5N5FT25_9ROSA|nr:S ribonuclease [Pyrus ussuriensis x Pyrus communis]